jgi:hypothetical protein
MTNKKSRLEKQVGITEVELSNDDRGFFISYCMLPYHSGIISVGRAEMCEQRRCDKYRKLYLNNGVELKTEDVHQELLFDK